MLVISRKAGESIIIGDDIEVVIIEAQNGKVKIGVKADNSIRILRKEIIDQDLDPDLYDLGEAERSLKYYWKNRNRINNKREYLKKALAKFMKRELSAPSTVNYTTLGYKDDDLDPYLSLYTEDLRARVEDVNTDVRERLQGIDQLAFVAHKRLVLAGAKKAGILK